MKNKKLIATLLLSIATLTATHVSGDIKFIGNEGNEITSTSGSIDALKEVKIDKPSDVVKVLIEDYAFVKESVVKVAEALFEKDHWYSGRKYPNLKEIEIKEPTDLTAQHVLNIRKLLVPMVKTVKVTQNEIETIVKPAPKKPILSPLYRIWQRIWRERQTYKVTDDVFIKELVSDEENFKSIFSKVKYVEITIKDLNTNLGNINKLKQALSIYGENITHLVINGCKNWETNLLDVLPSMKKLEVLILKSLHIPGVDVFYESINGIPNLRKLRIKNCTGPSKKELDYSDINSLPSNFLTNNVNLDLEIDIKTKD